MKYVILTITATLIFSFIYHHPVFAAEVVIIHKVVDQETEDYNLKLETIRSLAIVLKNIKNGQFRLGNKCTIEDIYFDGDSTHINISCRKIWP